MSKAIVMIDIPTDYADEYKQWLIDGRLCYLEDGVWTFLKEVEYKVEPYRESIADTLQLNLQVPLNEIVKAVENSVIDALYVQPTVNAIPIEWIKNYARHKASKGFTEIDCYWQYWKDDVLEMVADWEKENERSE